MQEKLIELLLHHSGAPPFTGNQDTSFIMRLLNGLNADTEFELVFNLLDELNKSLNGGQKRADAFSRDILYGMNELVGTLLFESFTKLSEDDVRTCRLRGKLFYYAWEAIVHGDCDNLRAEAKEMAEQYP